MPCCAWVLRGLGRTIGVLGTGKIGECFVRIMRGMSATTTVALTTQYMQPPPPYDN